MARQDKDSQYGSGSYGSYNSSTNRSGRTTSTTGSGGGGGYTPSRETYRTSNSYKTSVTLEQREKAKAQLDRDKKANDLKRLNELQYEKPTGLAKFSPLAVGMHVTGIGKKTFEVNKSYFQKNDTC